MKKRLFIAIPLSEEILEQLESYKHYLNLKNIHWMSKQNLHITLYFLGNVKEEEIPDLIDRLNSALIGTKAFSLIFEKITFAPPNKESRMIWAQFKNNKNYDQISRLTYNAIHKFADNKEDPEEKTIIPHVTLARFRNLFNANNITLEQPEIPKLEVKSCFLMESELNSNGSIYSTVATFFFDIV